MLLIIYDKGIEKVKDCIVVLLKAKTPFWSLHFGVTINLVPIF